jgi:hypothetical protein
MGSTPEEKQIVRKSKLRILNVKKPGCLSSKGI